MKAVGNTERIYANAVDVIPREELERRLKSRGRDSAGVTLYERLERRGTGAGAYDISSWLRVRYTRGRVAAFSARLITST